ncbi:hypothetical protein MFRU_004g04180 [Monilinia fructicola]|nr:hypothetical protein MFRU_004g04180 [Monilinia fructicola]
MRFTKEKQEQLRAAKEKKGKKVIQEERRAHRAVRAQESMSAAAAVNPADTAPFAASQVLQPGRRAIQSRGSSGHQLSRLYPQPHCCRPVPASYNFPCPTTKAHQASFSERIVAAAAKTPGRHRHKRASAPSQSERLSKRGTFRELTGLPLANLGLGLNLGGSIAPDIIGNWPAEALGKELYGSDDDEDEDMGDDGDDDDDDDDDDEDEDEDEEMENQGYDSEVYDSDGNEWAALGVKMKM